MSLYNDLIRNDFSKDIDGEELHNIQNRADFAVNNLMQGIGSIGNLMFWASASEDYPGETAKTDMYHIGAMLEDMTDVIRALNDTASNALYTRLSKEAKPTKRGKA